MANKTMEARRAVYRRLYEKRVESPEIYIPVCELQEVAHDSELTAALFFGREMGHLESRRGHWRMTAFGMLYAEMENYVEGEN